MHYLLCKLHCSVIIPATWASICYAALTDSCNTLNIISHILQAQVFLRELQPFSIVSSYSAYVPTCSVFHLSEQLQHNYFAVTF